MTKSMQPSAHMLTVAVCVGAIFAACSWCALDALASPAAVRPADAARTISLTENGHLHLTSKHNFTLNEVGTASGTASGTIYVRLTAVSTSVVKAEISIYPHGGSLAGSGTAGYHRSGTVAQFSGSMAIDQGTGSYARVHGSGLRFSGSIAESDRDAITVQVSGRVSN
jgi:hypothetical protein